MPDSPPHRKGRPRLDPTDRSVGVTLTLPERQFDEYCRRALRRGLTVPEIIRRDLQRTRPPGA
jgi:hypothetical protein